MPLGSPDTKVFINYRREDTAPYALLLHDRLAAHFGEDQVFIDIDKIEPGEDFVEVINRKVGACEIAIILIGPKWLSAADASGNHRLSDNEDFVRMEIIAALERKIRVIPVLVGGARMPRKQDLPEVLAPLSRRNGLELGETRFHADVTRLIDAIEKPRLLGGKETSPLPTPIVKVAGPAFPRESPNPENLRETSTPRPPVREDPPPKAVRSYGAAFRNIVVIILTLLLIAVFPGWGYSSGWGYYPFVVIGLVLVLFLAYRRRL